MPRQRKSRAESQREQRERILRVASELFAKRGLRNTPLWEIAQGAGMSHTQVLDLFGHTKDNIIVEVLRSNWEQANAVVRAIADDQTIDAKQKLQLLYRQTIGAIRDAGAAGVVAIMESREPGELGEKFVQARLADFTTLVDGIILEGQQQGVFRSDLDAQAIRQQLIGCGENILLGWIWKEQTSYPADYSFDDACRVFDALLNGLSMETSSDAP